MFGRQQTTFNDVNVNTQFKTFFGDNASLSIGGWNTQISIKMSPCIGTNPDGGRKYDSQRRVSTAIVPEKALALKTGIERYIYQAISDNRKESISVAISMGSDNNRSIIKIAYELKDSKPVITLYLYNPINDDNTCSNDSVLSYTFGTSVYAINYDNTTGEIEEELESESEFEIFYTILARCVSLYGLEAHADKHVSAVSKSYNKTPDNSIIGTNMFNRINMDVLKG